MSLAKVLEHLFRGDVRHRGAAYLKATRVSIVRVSPDNLYAVVRDGQEHQTQLSRVDGELKMFCSSVEGTNKPTTTKYVWATILAVDEGGYLSGTPKLGAIPPFVTTDPHSIYEGAWDAEDDDGGDDDDVGLGGKASVAVKRAAAAASATAASVAPLRATPLRDWEQRLKKMKDESPSANRHREVTERESEILYEIDVEASKQTLDLVIQLSMRQRRTGGGWGKMKALKLKPGQLDHIESPEDRQILSYLHGAYPERPSAAKAGLDRPVSVSRYRVAVELAEFLFPMMCPTGRVRFLGDSETKGAKLGWDSEVPWEFCLNLSWDEKLTKWKLDGEFRRDQETLALSAAKLIVPGGLFVTNEKICRLVDYQAFDWIRTIQQDGPIYVKEGEQEELIDRLLDQPVLPRLEMPEELQLEEVHVQPMPSLSVQTPAAGMNWMPDRLEADVEFDYGGVVVRGSSPQWALLQREEQRCLVRSRKFERDCWSQLQQAGFRRYLDQRLKQHDVEISARNLGPAVKSLIDQGWQVKASGRQIRKAGTLAFKVRSDIDWFGLSAEVNFEGATVSFPELLSALVRGDTTIMLSDGSLGILPEEWARQYGLLAGLGQFDGEEMRFSAGQISLLDALLSTQQEVDYDQKFLDIRAKFDLSSSPELLVEPIDFRGELRPYQRHGLGWLRFLQELNFGGCLADDMGLGKTIQVLALLLDRKTQHKAIHPSLVVVPKSLLFNWKQEAERFAPQLRVLEYTGSSRGELQNSFDQHDLIITTYGTLRRDVVGLKDLQFDYIVLDEAQTIKNAHSQVAKSARLLNSKFRLALSGTPIENHLGDLWSIFEFLNPGLLGKSSIFKTVTADVKNLESRKLLAHGLKPFVLRRTKQEVATDLPEKTEQTIYCDMNEDQQRLYDELRDHYRASLLGMVKSQGLGKTKMHVLEALLRLRQAACHPALLDAGARGEPFAKLDALCPMLGELIEGNHKSIVFSQFTSMLSIVKEHLDKAKIKYVYLDGQTRNREEIVNQFQNDETVPVFLISLKAGGLGLNLTAAEYVFLLDPWWNPAVEAQAIDRAHRIGQTRQVFAYRLITRGTVEEKIAELQKSKKELADSILEADQSVMSNLTAEDLHMLLS